MDLEDEMERFQSRPLKILKTEGRRHMPDDPYNAFDAQGAAFARRRREKMARRTPRPIQLSCRRDDEVIPKVWESFLGRTP